MPTPIDDGGVEGSAQLSEDGWYRYRLDRWWDEARPRLAWVMLNPSTADASADDPTIRRCIRFTKDWGYGGLLVVNLFALRATDPRTIDRHPDPVGAQNAQALQEAVSAHQVILAWGARVGEMAGETREYAAAAARVITAPGASLFPPVLCLGRTATGHPRHPLYVRADTAPVPFEEVSDAD